jgi:8-oxo-dGTP pyrophosphatase MutT (NUDIX family)
MLPLDILGERCAEPAHAPLEEARCAAVALIFAHGADGLELCFVKRKEYPGDPWSGQMALPGGKRNPGDISAHQVAIREVQEEVGLNLDDSQLLGMMTSMDAGGARGRLPVFPVLYQLDGPGPKLTIGEELAEGHWISVRHLWDRDNWSSLDWNGNNFAGIAHGERIIWGFTLGILTRLSEIAGMSIRDVYS